jgi:hypothetical protein
MLAFTVTGASSEPRKPIRLLGRRRKGGYRESDSDEVGDGMRD